MVLFSTGVQIHGRAARPKSLRTRPKRLRAPDEKISQRCEDQSQRVLQVDRQKNRGRLIATAALVLPLGLGKFGHVLDVDLQKIKVIYC